jgi:glutamate/tyrosine decarboxylase-like PLP-dependent enzyme
LFDLTSLSLLAEAAAVLDRGFDALPEFGAFEPAGASKADASSAHAQLRDTLLALAEKLRDNYPYPHPLYAGQMLKPPHPIAHLAYALAMLVNPNNHALDGGRATSALEREAVAELAAMVGFAREAHLGHLTSGGTMANLEALWVAGRVSGRVATEAKQPGVVVASKQAHYTHERISAVLGLPFEPIAAALDGRMDVAALEARLARGGVSTVVATLGTTGLGAVDPLPAILALRERFGFRLHVDAAYGGYFGLIEELPEHARAAFDRLGEADSIVIDPHKHGLQPYGCGCVLFRDPSVGRFYKHDSPYTYFTSGELHLGEITLECSRPGASAAALWATQRLLPPARGGDFAARLSASRRAALALADALASSPRWRVPLAPTLDIVVWAPAGARATEISARSRRIFEAAARRDLHLALIGLPVAMLGAPDAAVERDAETVTCLRSVLMKPEHEAWIPAILERLEAARAEAG